MFQNEYAGKLKLFQPIPTAIDETSSALQIEKVSKDTQFQNLKVLKQTDLMQEGENFSQSEENLAKMLADASITLNEQGKKFKVTVKKNYINDVLMYNKGA